MSSCAGIRVLLENLDANYLAMPFLWPTLQVMADSTGHLGECPHCGRPLDVTAAVASVAGQSSPGEAPVEDFEQSAAEVDADVDPNLWESASPQAAASFETTQRKNETWRRMFEALIKPRSISMDANDRWKPVRARLGCLADQPWRI